MELVRGWHNLRPAHRGCVATIGNFDGVHLGHRAILDQLAALAERVGAPATVVIFEPQPREFFQPAAAPARLTRLREKLDAIRASPVDRVLVLRFHRGLAGLEPEAFVDRLLVGALGVRRLVVGDDFRFGRGGAGDAALLRERGRAHGFAVEACATHELGGERVSSTRVRAALERGDLEAARALLGRRYAVCGRVVHGDARGRAIGFPTMNVPLRRRACALRGVYAVRVEGLGGSALGGMANVGTRPTIGGERLQLEVHAFDLDREAYGREVRVEFVAKLRDEVRFGSLAELIDQLGRDREAALVRLGAGTP